MTTPQKVAIVTGGARRIGRAIVEDLAAHGWAVAIHCNSSRIEADSLAAEIIGAGGAAAVVQADLADLGSAAAVVYELATKLGRASLLVNNASILEEDHLGTLEPARFNRQMTVNFAAPVFLTQAFAAVAEVGRQCRQHRRPARLADGADLLLLPDVEVGAVGRHPHPGPGACAAHPGQCHRARARC